MRGWTGLAPVILPKRLAARLLRFNLCNCLRYMEMRDHVEQKRGERNDHYDDSEPEVYERVLVFPGLGRGDAEDNGETSEYRG